MMYAKLYLYAIYFKIENIPRKKEKRNPNPHFPAYESWAVPIKNKKVSCMTVFQIIDHLKSCSNIMIYAILLRPYQIKILAVDMLFTRSQCEPCCACSSMSRRWRTNWWGGVFENGPYSYPLPTRICSDEQWNSYSQAFRRCNLQGNMLI